MHWEYGGKVCPGIYITYIAIWMKQRDRWAACNTPGGDQVTQRLIVCYCVSLNIKLLLYLHYKRAFTHPYILRLTDSSLPLLLPPFPSQSQLMNSVRPWIVWEKTERAQRRPDTLTVQKTPRILIKVCFLLSWRKIESLQMHNAFPSHD